MVSQSQFVRSQKRYYDKVYTERYQRTSIPSQGFDSLVLMRVIYHFTKHKKKLKILDIGCGTGALIDLIGNRLEGDTTLYGIDISPVAITKGKRLFTGTDLICGDASDLPYKNSYFDIVISFGSFEHCYDPSKVISEMKRVLKKSGLFFLKIDGINKIYSGITNKEIDVITTSPPTETDDIMVTLKRPDGAPSQVPRGRFLDLVAKGFGKFSDKSIKADMGDIEITYDSKPNGEIYNNEGWNFDGQPQWNLSRHTWRKYFNDEGLKLWGEQVLKPFKASNPDSFFLGEK